MSEHAQPVFDPERIETQAQLDAALAAKAPQIIIVGGTWDDPLTLSGNAQATLSGNAQATLSGNARATLSENAQATLSGNARATLSENAQATLYENAQATLSENAQATLSGNARATLYENAQATLYGNAQATLSGNAQATLYENAQATATGVAQLIVTNNAKVDAGPYNAVTLLPGFSGSVSGGVIIVAPEITTPKDWCAYYGVVVTDGVALVYKALGADFKSPKGMRYLPGTSPEAPDWDGEKRECGGGLHFSPLPSAALQFNPDGVRFVACPVALADMRAPKPNDEYPNKIKARRVCGPIVEVDRYGTPVPITQQATE